MLNCPEISDIIYFRCETSNIAGFRVLWTKCEDVDNYRLEYIQTGCQNESCSKHIETRQTFSEVEIPPQQDVRYCFRVRATFNDDTRNPEDSVWVTMSTGTTDQSKLLVTCLSVCLHILHMVYHPACTFTKWGLVITSVHLSVSLHMSNSIIIKKLLEIVIDGHI